jgi:DNA-binding transcriptional LysR family regulator
MELRHLRYFVAAAEEEHFGRASDRLHVTRPAVSQIIADLEEEIGTPLFERLAHRVKLTAAGRSLLPRIRGVMTNLEEAVLLAKRVGQGKSGSLNIGYGTLTLLHPLFPAAIQRFQETCPDVTLSLFEWSTTDQPRALAEGKIQGGFMQFGPDQTLSHKSRSTGVGGQDENVLEWCVIQTGGIGVAVPRNHRLAKRKAVKFAELAGERFVVVPRSSSSPGYGPLYALSHGAGFEPDIGQEAGTIGTQLNVISLGMAIGLAVTGPKFVYPSSVAIIPLEDVAYSTSFVFGWIKGQRDPALDRMIEIVESLSR